MIASGPTSRSTVATLASGHQRAVLRAHIDFAEGAFVGAVLGGDLHDDLVAVAGSVDGRDLALAESAVERGADVGDLHAQQVGLVAVDIEARLQAFQLRVAGDIAEHGVVAHARHQAIGRGAQVFGAHAAHDVLVAALADAAAQPEVLDRVDEDIDAGDDAHLAPQLFDHLVDGRALAARFEAHEHAPAVAVAGIDDQRVDGGIGAYHVAGALQQLGHGGKGNILDRLHRDDGLADILIGEKSLGQEHEQRDGGDQGGERNAQHDAAVAQCPVERAFIGRQHLAEAALKPCGPFHGRGLSLASCWTR